MKKTLAGIVSVLMLLALVSCATSATPLSDEEKYAGMVFNKTQYVSYATLAEAVAAANPDDVLVMYKDEVVINMVQIKVPLTLDMNGHTLESASAGCALFVRKGSDVIEGTVVVKNGTIKGKPTGNGTSSLFAYVDVDKTILSDLTVISNVDAGQETPAATLYFNGVRDAQVNNCTVTGKVIAYQRKANDTSVFVTINGGTYVQDPNAPEDQIIRLSGDDGSRTGSVVVNDASFAGTVGFSSTHATLTINSGTWTSDVTEYVAPTSSIANDGGVWKITKN